MLNIDRNIVNVCFNFNTNLVSGGFTGGAQTQAEPPTLTCPECIENALTGDQETTLANFLARLSLNLDTYCALPPFQSATTVEQVRSLLLGDFNASGIVLSDTQLDELAECVFEALNGETTV